jgi:hypothetical protein
VAHVGGREGCAVVDDVDLVKDGGLVEHEAKHPPIEEIGMGGDEDSEVVKKKGIRLSAAPSPPLSKLPYDQTKAIAVNALQMQTAYQSRRSSLSPRDDVVVVGVSAEPPEDGYRNSFLPLLLLLSSSPFCCRGTVQPYTKADRV